MKDFDKKSDAEDFAEKRNENAVRDRMFCPLIKDRCKSNCVCFSLAVVKECECYDNEGNCVKWAVYNEYPGCYNGMFEREIQCSGF